MFEDRLKKLRLARGLSQAQLAEELGLPQNTYRNYENNEREPSSNTLIKIATYFGVTLDYLLNYHCGNKNIIFSSQNDDSNNIINNLSEKFIDHLKKYEKLNDLGKSKLDERLEELLELPKYQSGKKSHQSTGRMIHKKIVAFGGNNSEEEIPEEELIERLKAIKERKKREREEKK